MWWTTSKYSSESKYRKFHNVGLDHITYEHTPWRISEVRMPPPGGDPCQGTCSWWTLWRWPHTWHRPAGYAGGVRCWWSQPRAWAWRHWCPGRRQCNCRWSCRRWRAPSRRCGPCRGRWRWWWCCEAHWELKVRCEESDKKMNMQYILRSAFK